MSDSFQRNHSVIRFGLFEVDPAAGELRKRGVRVKVQDQPFQVLLTLLENPNEVVTRNELRNRLWPGDTYVDFDQGLNRAVAKLRDVLDDPAEKPVYIQTITRRGYRFLAPVERFEPAPRSGGAEPAHRGATSWWRWAAIALSIALLTGFAFRRKVSTPRAQEPIRSLAVLPLDNLSGDPSQEYFADGMTDALITELAHLNGVSVISRTSVMNFKGRHVPLQEIARELNVDAVIEGTVMRSGERVRITVQLIRASTDRHLWAGSYEEQLQNVIGLQDSIAQDVAEQIHAELAQAPKSKPTSPAYDSYLRGRSYLIASTNTRQALTRAQTYFERAIQDDPNFAPAYSGLADCYVLLSEFRWLSPEEAYAPAMDAARKALELDQTLTEAYTALAWLSWRHDWDWQSAEREYRRAIELNPSDVESHQGLSWYLAWNHRSSEAQAEVAKIRELDPAQDAAIDEAAIYYHQRQYPALVEAGRKSVAARSDYWVGHYFLAVGYEGSGRLSDAIAEYRNAVEISQEDVDALAGLAHAYAVSGKRSEAKEILKRLQQAARSSYVSPYMIATIYVGLGERDKAFEYLEKAYEERSTDLPYFLSADLRLDALRSDPRFRNLVQKVGLHE